MKLHKMIGARRHINEHHYASFFVTFAQLRGDSLHVQLDLDPVASLGKTGLAVLASELALVLSWKINCVKKKRV